jgi:hypothetical protein
VGERRERKGEKGRERQEIVFWYSIIVSGETAMIDEILFLRLIKRKKREMSKKKRTKV